MNLLKAIVFVKTSIYDRVLAELDSIEFIVKVDCEPDERRYEC